MDKIRLGISACLTGQRVRYDGGHKLDHFLVDTLGPFVEFVPVCPEVECGLPVPRDAMHLEGDPADPRLITIRTRIDHTARMKKWAAKQLRKLERDQLCGFIFKSNSPSSGMERVRIYDGSRVVSKTGVGLFARALIEHFPLLPVEDDGRLHDPALRENFIERLFVFRRWQELAERCTLGRLAEFHACHKLLLLAHSPRRYTELGRLVAAGKNLPAAELFRQYQTTLMTALKILATPARHVNVLHHILGYFKQQLTADEKQELLETIDAYRGGHVPLIVPITLINHHVRKQGQPYLAQQYYLHPHPIELQLRNHV